jgi:hypothetical protein
MARIADSDSTWAALFYTPSPGLATGQPFEEVASETNGTWTSVSDGTSQVACNPSVPPNVQADFANLPGFGNCPGL